jgi:hypothetical protein
MYLGLDVSTSCIGWSIIGDSGQYVDGGYIDFSPKKLKLDKNLFLKMNHFEKMFLPILNKYKDKIDHWAVEEAVKKFSFGHSSAGTIFKLASFNFGVVYFVYKQLDKEPVYIPANAARKLCELQFPKDIDKSKKKEYIVDWCSKAFPSLKWENNRAGNVKKQSFDQADSIVVSKALYNKLCCQKKQLTKDIK